MTFVDPTEATRFCGSETSLERVLTRKIVLYIFVCKTHKNGKIWSKFR